MATILKTIRLEGKDSDFLSRITSDPGVVYYNKTSNTLQLFNGDSQGGVELLKADLSNIAGGGGGGGNVDFGNKIVIADEFQGDFTGNVTGNLNGNVTGNVTGNLNGNVTGNLNGNVTGNSSTATKLITARAINGVNFDGSSDITIETAGSTTSASPPNDPNAGDIWFNSNSGIQYIYTGAQWVQPFNATAGQDLTNLATRSNPTFTGLMTVNASSDFNGTVQFDNVVTFNNTVSGLTKSSVGLANVTNESKATMFTNAALTGVPTAPTATAGTNTTQLATTAFVRTAITNLIGAAPAALDTLTELADAINDDASFASSVTTSLALKANIASPAFTGTVNLGTNARFTTGATVSSFSTDLTMANNSLTAVPVERVVKQYVDTGLALKADANNPSLTGTVSIGTIGSPSVINVNGRINAWSIRSRVDTDDSNVSGTYTMDCNLNDTWAFSVTGATTLAFSNIPSAGTRFEAFVFITNGGGGSIASFPTGTVWPSGVAPTLSTASTRTDVFSFTTFDGGVKWYAVIVGQNYA